MTIFIFGGEYSGTPWIWTLWQFSFWGVFWNTSDLDSMTIFILGGYSGTPQIWTLWQFSFSGGILGHLRFGLYDNFHFGGVFWDTLDLDSMTIFIFGGEYSGTPWIWTLWQFSFWGGILKHLGFGLSDNFHLGVFWDTSDLDSMTIFIWGEYLGTPWIWILWQFSFGGSILGHLGFGLYDNFHFGGYSGTPRIWTLWQFSFWGGVFWDTLDLDSLTIFILGAEYSGTPWIWTLWQFSFWGDILGHLGFGLYDNFHFGGVFWDTLDLDSMTIFIGGSILGHLGDLDSLTIFILGLFSDTSDLDSLTIFIWGEGEGQGQGQGQGIGRGGGILQNRGILWHLNQNFNHSSRLMHHR